MASQTTKSVFTGTLKTAFQKALKDSHGAPVEIKGFSLPEGINNGVAQLREIGIKTYETGENRGKPYFSGMGLVCLPVAHKGIKVKGLHTRLTPEPLFDTPARRDRKTADQHIRHMLDRLKVFLGTDAVDNLMQMGDKFEDGLNQLFDVLRQQRPYFRFRTWLPEDKPKLGQPQPGQKPPQKYEQRVVEIWGEVCVMEGEESPAEQTQAEEMHDHGDDVGDVQDYQDTGNGDIVITTPTPPPMSATKPGPSVIDVIRSAGDRQRAATPLEPQSTDEDDQIPFDDGATIETGQTEVSLKDTLDGLVGKAVRKDKEARQALLDMSKEVGIPPDEAKAVKTWRRLADLILEYRESQGVMDE